MKALTIKELQEWEHYDDFIKLRLEEYMPETTEEFLSKVKEDKYLDLAQIIICTAWFEFMPKWKKIWNELTYGDTSMTQMEVAE